MFKMMPYVPPGMEPGCVSDSNLFNFRPPFLHGRIKTHQRLTHVFLCDEFKHGTSGLKGFFLNPRWAGFAVEVALEKKSEKFRVDTYGHNLFLAFKPSFMW